MTPQELIKNIPSIEETNCSGIYMIYCISSGRAYIGLSKNIYRRWTMHKAQLKRNRHDNDHLQKAYNKYGKDRFIYLVLERCSSDILNDREYYYCTLLDKDYLYNILPVGDLFVERFCNAIKPAQIKRTADSYKSMLGKSHPKETQDRINLTRLKDRGYSVEMINSIRKDFITGLRQVELRKKYNLLSSPCNRIVKCSVYVSEFFDQELIEQCKSVKVSSGPRIGEWRPNEEARKKMSDAHKRRKNGLQTKI